MSLIFTISNAKNVSRKLTLNFLSLTKIIGAEPSIGTTVKDNVVQSTMSGLNVDPSYQHWCHVRNIVLLGSNFDTRINGAGAGADYEKIEMPTDYVDIYAHDSTDAELNDVISRFYDPGRHHKVVVTDGVFNVEVTKDDIVPPPYGDPNSQTEPNWSNAKLVNKNNKIFFLYTKINLPYYLRTLFGSTVNNIITESINSQGQSDSSLNVENTLTTFNFNVQNPDAPPSTISDNTRLVWVGEQAYLRTPMYFVPKTQKAEIKLNFSEVSNFYGPERGQPISLTSQVFQMQLNFLNNGE